MRISLWLSSPDAVARFLRAETDEARSDILTLTESSLNMRTEGWTHVCDVDVPIPPIDRTALLTSTITAVETGIQNVRAEAEQKCRRMNASLQNLLALEHNPSGDL